VDTAVIGAAGAGLTAIPWNTAWDTEVQSECTDALNAYDPPTKTELDSAFTEIKGATWASGTDTLEHIRDKETDIEADTQDLQTQIGAAGAGLTAVVWNSAWDVEVQSECTDALNAYDPPTKTELDSAFTEIKGATWASGTDTLEHIRDKETDIEADTQDLQTQIGAAGAGLTAIPWNASWDTEVQSECNDALIANHLDHLFATTYNPVSKPGAADSLLNIIFESDIGVPRFTANALEEAPTGGSAPTVEEIRIEMDTNSTKFSSIETDTQDLQTQVGTAGAGLTAVPWNAAWDVEVQSECTDALNTYDPPTKAELDSGLTALNDVSTAEVEAACDASLVSIHLDHLLAVDYDPSSKPGVATALLNELIESDGGISRFTANALEQAPSGTGATAGELADAVWDEIRFGHAVVGSFGETIEDLDSKLPNVNIMGSSTKQSMNDEIDDIITNIAALNDLSALEVNAEVDAAIETYHLDHLLAVDYDPASKPGVATALLNEIIDDDSGVSRFTANALELAPGGGGSGSGSNQVELTIEEVDTTPIPDVKITILNSDSTVLIATGMSDSNGEANFALDDGSYKVLLSRIGWSFTVPENLAVDESPETATFNGTEVSVGSPPAADVCRIYEYCVDQDGDPLSAVTSYAAITDRPFDDGSGMYEKLKAPGTYDSGTGLIYWDIVKSAKVFVEIQEIGLYKKYTVPDQANARLGDLTPI
jgi:acyl CoA:acetate/3-ketoacid CoA transferase alpha subunit